MTPYSTPEDEVKTVDELTVAVSDPSRERAAAENEKRLARAGAP